MTTILRGRTLSFLADPFERPPAEAVRVEEDGAVVIENGRIRALGPAGEVLAAYTAAELHHFPEDWILPGFIDCHAHYPQLGVIASYGAQLLDWLERYTFPEELRFADPNYARATAERFLDILARNGTTAVCAYCTVHRHSVTALFAAAEARGVRVAAGKMMMDRNAPDGLTDDAQSSYDDSKTLLEAWHGRGRATYAISPRFAPTSTSAQLEAAGALWAAHPTALMQTHLSENPREIEWVGQLFPDATDYLDVYQKAGLAGPGAIFGHAIHLTERERAGLAESGSGVAHCPTSNAFIGSGLCDVHGLAGSGQAGAGTPIGLATDVGGGSSFSMLSTMRSAYEIAQLRGQSLHPAQAFYLATLGSARVMRLEERIGNLEPGMEADLIVLDPNATPALADRSRRVENWEEALFALAILGDDRAVRRTYAAGRLLHDRDAPLDPPGSGALLSQDPSE